MKIEILLKNATEELGINLNSTQIKKFIAYKELLLEYNKKVNLTAITDEKEIILKHFVDCLTLAKFRDLNNKNTIDIGTGAGFPAIPLKIFFENAKFTLVDSLNKRVNFLKELCKELNLNNIEIIHGRAEDIGLDKSYREMFDFCISRAVAKIAPLAEYSLPFVKIGGEFIALKGPSYEEEILNSENTIKVLGGKLRNVENLNIPFSDMERNLIFIEKLAKTPEIYPRKSVKIIKNPI